MLVNISLFQVCVKSSCFVIDVCKTLCLCACMCICRQNLTTGQGRCEKYQAELAKLTEELSQESVVRRQLESILQEAATALKDILKVMNHQTVSLNLSKN